MAVRTLAIAAALAPALAQYYWRYRYADTTADVIGIIVDFERDQLMAACNGNPDCGAFNTAGLLKRPGGNMTTDAFLDLYVQAPIPQPPRLSVLPKPSSIVNGSTMLLVSPALTFVATTPSPDLTSAFERYSALIFPTAVSATSNAHFPSTQATLASVTVSVANVTVPLQLGVDEAYSINIPADGSAAVITASTVYGALRALETLSQLVHFDFDMDAYRLDFAPLLINDAPAFPYRGLLIDTSRHYQPVSSLKAILDSMSYAKMNVLHWHVVDYQSWPVQSRAYPLLWSSAWSQRERYTLADLAAVVEYARQRGILVIPEFDTPGHGDAICTGYPEACPSPNCTTPLNPANNVSLDIVRAVLTEWATVFPSQTIHAGGDEVVYDCWSASAPIQAWMAAHDYSLDQTYEYFVLQVDEMVASLGKSAIRWEEVWNHFGTNLPIDTIIHVWLDHATLANVTASGYHGILSNNDVYYLDNLGVTWSAFYDNDLLANISANATQYVLGGETCMWGEKADVSDVLQTVWPRAAAAAERQWSYHVVTNSSDPAAMQRMNDFRCHLNARGVPAAPVTNLVARQGPDAPGSCEWQ